MIYGFTRQDARLLKLKRYIGSQCVHGHHEGRQTVNGSCMACMRDYDRRFRKKNLETVRERDKRYSREFRKMNLEAVRKRERIYARRYREKNAEACRERERKYIKNNPEKEAAKDAKRRARKLEALVPGESNSAFKDCKLVAKMLELEYRIPFHVDHIYPLSKGGAHAGLNFQVISAEDNRRKCDKTDFTDYQDPRWVHPEADWLI